MHFLLDDEKFSHEFPGLCNRIRMLNVRLRSYCATGNSEAIEEDDGGFPRISAAEFDAEEALELRRILEAAPIGKRPKKATYITVFLTIDYGNGCLEERRITLFKEDPAPMFREIRERSLYLFRSLYGFRKGPQT